MRAPLSIANVTSAITLIYGAVGNQDTPLQVVNLDNVNTVWIGNVSNVQPNNPNAFPLYPGASVAFDGSASIWAVTLSGVSVQVAITPGAINYSPPPQVQYSTIINDTSGHTISAAAGTYTTPIYSVVNFQSYSLAVTAYCATQGTAGAPLTCPVILRWYADAAGTMLLETDMYWCWVSQSTVNAARCPLIGGGPARGAYLSIQFANMSLGVSVPMEILTIVLTGNNRVQSATKFSQSAPLMTSGVTYIQSINPGVVESLAQYPNGADGILCNEINNNALNVNSTYWLPLPLFTGTVTARFETSTALNNDLGLGLAMGLTNGGISFGTATLGDIWNPGNTASTEYATTLEVPNCPLYVTIHTAGVIPTFSLVIAGVQS